MTLQPRHGLVGDAIQPHRPPRQPETKRKWTSITVVMYYKPLVHSHSLSRTAASASSQGPLSWKGGCRDAKLNFSDRHHLFYSPLQILTEVADDFCARKMHLGHSFPKHLFSLLSVRLLILFIFSTIAFFLFPSFLWGKEEHIHTKTQQDRKLNLFTKMIW